MSVSGSENDRMQEKTKPPVRNVRLQGDKNQGPREMPPLLYFNSFVHATQSTSTSQSAQESQEIGNILIESRNKPSTSNKKRIVPVRQNNKKGLQNKRAQRYRNTHREKINKRRRDNYRRQQNLQATASSLHFDTIEAVPYDKHSGIQRVKRREDREKDLQEAQKTDQFQYSLFINDSGSTSTDQDINGVQIKNEPNERAEGSCIETSLTDNSLDIDIKEEDIKQENINLDFDMISQENSFPQEADVFPTDNPLSDTFLLNNESQNVSLETDNASSHFNTSKNMSGRRLVDFNYFMNELHNIFDNHSADCNCRIRDLEHTDTTITGLQTLFHFKCKMCNYTDEIWSESMENENFKT